MVFWLLQCCSVSMWSCVHDDGLLRRYLFVFITSQVFNPGLDSVTWPQKRRWGMGRINKVQSTDLWIQAMSIKLGGCVLAVLTCCACSSLMSYHRCGCSQQEWACVKNISQALYLHKCVSDYLLCCLAGRNVISCWTKTSWFTVQIARFCGRPLGCIIVTLCPCRWGK